jgi:hypothetical protein
MDDVTLPVDFWRLRKIVKMSQLICKLWTRRAISFSLRQLRSWDLDNRSCWTCKTVPGVENAAVYLWLLWLVRSGLFFADLSLVPRSDDTLGTFCGTLGPSELFAGSEAERTSSSCWLCRISVDIAPDLCGLLGLRQSVEDLVSGQSSIEGQSSSQETEVEVVVVGGKPEEKCRTLRSWLWRTFTYKSR